MYLNSGQNLEQSYKIKDIKAESLFHRFKFYIFPLAALVLMIAMIFWQIIPSIDSLSGRYSELDKQKLKTDKLTQQINNIKNYLSSNNTNIAYIKDSMSKFLPEYAGEAVGLQDQVTSLINFNGLSLSKFKTGEQISTLDDYKTFDKVDPLKFRSYPTEITINGSLNGISSMFGAIYKNQPLFVINKFDLKRNDLINDSWNANLVFTQYSFRSGNTDTLNTTADFSNYQFDTKYLDYFKLKQ